MTLHGIGASAGVGLGTIVCVREQDLDHSGVVYSGAEQEKARLDAAAEAFCEKTQRMVDTVLASAGEKESEILTGQIMMLNDPFMLSQMKEAIDGGAVAEAAVDSVCTLYADMFAGVDDELMRQRAMDVRDIRARMLALLLGQEAVDLTALPGGTVLAAHDLTPSMTVGLERNRIAAVITETGGLTSHSAILARALEVPAVLSVPGLLAHVENGMLAAVDGGQGTVLLQPDESQQEEYRARRQAHQREREMLKAYREKPTLDADGRHYGLYANIGTPQDALAARQAGAEGIGLFRTEFLFMDRPAAPSEEEQYAAYCQAAAAMEGREVIIRTLDVGGDKAVGYLHMAKEENPFLGHRAIRYCLDEKSLFKTQLRALLRAGAEHHNVKIMLPLVTSVEEVRAARALLEECKEELRREGLPFDSRIHLGVMIETPAAALIADLLAREADFFSIGTNDLTQYTMAVDRGNAMVEKLYTTFHPGVLRSIREVIRAAKEAGIPVGMCGEAAADPALTPVLLAFGLDEFSVNASAVPAVRRSISRWSAVQAEETARTAMGFAAAEEVQAYLNCAAR